MGGGIITDPARPDLPGYRWATRPRGAPWTGFAWGGGGLVDRPAAGGMAIVPDSDSGVVRVEAWWSGAPYLRLVRIVDGRRYPVRGAYPVQATTLTRYNRCTNPSFEIDTTGWVAGTNTTVTRLADASAAAGAAVGRIRATAAGAVSTSVPTALATEQPTSLALALRLSAAPTGALTLTASWQNATGGALTPSVATLSAAALAAYVGIQMPRTPALTVTPPAGAVQGTLTLTIAGMPAAGTADVDAVLIEYGETIGGYFDGDRVTGAWAGTAHLTQSTLAAALLVVDAEAPLDVDIAYELTAPDQPAFRITSEPVQLDSQTRTWLSHPTLGLPTVVHVSREPEQTYAIERAVFRVMGRSRPVPVTGGVRQAATGTHELWVETFAQRDGLLALLSDGLPLLLRAPAQLGHGPGEWISVADVTVKAISDSALEGSRSLTLPFDVVDPPAVELVA